MNNIPNFKELSVLGIFHLGYSESPYSLFLMKTVMPSLLYLLLSFSLPIILNEPQLPLTNLLILFITVTVNWIGVTSVFKLGQKAHFCLFINAISNHHKVSMKETLRLMNIAIDNLNNTFTYKEAYTESIKMKLFDLHHTSLGN